MKLRQYRHSRLLKKNQWNLPHLLLLRRQRHTRGCLWNQVPQHFLAQKFQYPPYSQKLDFDLRRLQNHHYHLCELCNLRHHNRPQPQWLRPC